MTTPNLSPRGFEVLTALWEIGAGTAREIQERLADGGLELAYTTILTHLERLLVKRCVRRLWGRPPYRYEPSLTLAIARAEMIDYCAFALFDSDMVAFAVAVAERAQVTPRAFGVPVPPEYRDPPVFTRPEGPAPPATPG